MIAPYRHVLFPTDLSADNDVAWAHAVKIALVNRGHLTTVHVLGSGDWIDWSGIPTVRELLWRWGALAPDATREDFAALGLHVQLHPVRDMTVVKGVLDELRDNDVDLIVMQSHRRDAMGRWLRPGVSKPIARRAGVPTLMLPAGARPFVSPATGAVSLRRFLLPIGTREDQQRAVDAAVALATSLGIGNCHGTLLHAGDAESMPELELHHAGWTWDVEVTDAPALAMIRQVAETVQPDVIVMATHRHDEPLDVMIGTVAERALDQAQCPVLFVPPR